MANLETLELTINANAEGASRGIDRLIGSLSRLSDALVKPFSDLADLNAEIAKLKNLRNIKIPDLKVAMNASSVARGAASASVPVFRNQPIKIDDTPKELSEAEKKALHPDWYRSREDFEAIVRQQQAKFRAEQAARKTSMPNSPVSSSATAATSATTANNSLSASAKAVETTMKSATTATRENAKTTEEAAASANIAKGAFGKLASQVGRIAKTMLIRTAVRSMIKSFSEAWSNAYTFSKRMGGQFATSMEQAKGAITGIATNIVKTFAPLISVVMPIINTIANGIQFLCNVISSLFKLLGLASEMFGATAESIASVGGASSGSAKDILAGFDELNTLDTGSGGGGGGGGSGITGLFNSEISAMTQVLVGEALLAVGLLLAFSGHVGIGLALAAVGAAAIASVVVEQWGKLSEEMKGEVTNIMLIASGAFLAIGLLLALAVPSQRGLGIGLMIAGIANMATAVTLAWNLTDDVRKNAAQLSLIVGESLIGIGMLLALAVPAHRGLGIALLAAGVASMASAVGLSWNLDSQVKKELTNIMVTAGACMLAVGAILALSGAATPLGIAMMAAGGVSLVAAAALNWGSLKSKIVSVFGSIRDSLIAIWEKVSGAVRDAWNSVVEWAQAKWSMFSRAWDNIKENFGMIWEACKRYASTAWEDIKSYLSSKWEEFKEGWKSIEKGFSEVWSAISGFVSEAWDSVAKWAESKWETFKTNWDKIKRQFGLIWSAILTSVLDAWDGVKKWVEAKWSAFQTGWKNIKESFAETWENIKSGVTGAWDEVKKWIEAKWSMFSSGWSLIKSQMIAIWQAISTRVVAVWNSIVDIANYAWSKFSSAWENIRDNFAKIWSAIKESVTNAWTSVVTWFSAKWDQFSTGWNDIKNKMGKIWEKVQGSVSDAWTKVKDWIGVAWSQFTNWETIRTEMRNVWQAIQGSVKSAYDTVSTWWSNTSSGMVSKIKSAWAVISGWFEEHVTNPVKKAFNSVIDTIKGWINVVIRGLNEIGHVHIPKIEVMGITLIPETDKYLWNIKELSLSTNAEGAYDIPKGQLFIANEAGAEMIGSMDGKTTVANQEQIIEGIKRGVYDAQSEQNALLREQNRLLLGIYEKDSTLRLGASAALGRIARQSLDMYGQSMGVV